MLFLSFPRHSKTNSSPLTIKTSSTRLELHPSALQTRPWLFTRMETAELFRMTLSVTWPFHMTSRVISSLTLEYAHCIIACLNSRLKISWSRAAFQLPDSSTIAWKYATPVRTSYKCCVTDLNEKWMHLQQIEHLHYTTCIDLKRHH